MGIFRTWTRRPRAAGVKPAAVAHSLMPPAAIAQRAASLAAALNPRGNGTYFATCSMLPEVGLFGAASRGAQGRVDEAASDPPFGRGQAPVGEISVRPSIDGSDVLVERPVTKLCETEQKLLDEAIARGRADTFREHLVVAARLRELFADETIAGAEREIAALRRLMPLKEPSAAVRCVLENGEISNEAERAAAWLRLLELQGAVAEFADLWRMIADFDRR